jgi:hypothetical protein
MHKLTKKEQDIRWRILQDVLVKAKRYGWVIADDIHEVLDYHRYPKTPTKRLGVVRFVLNEKNFNLGPKVVSLRPAARGREVRAWWPKK